MPLQHESSTPFYIQIKEDLQTKIQAGAYAIGSQLPSERELAIAYDVSRMTARQALQLLAQEGLTISRVGKGTFVSVPRIEQELLNLTSFSEDMARRGTQTSSRVELAELQPAPESIAKRLKLPAGVELVILQRIRLSDGMPMALEASHLPHIICRHILNNHDFSQESLYKTLFNDYGIVLTWAEQTISARLPTDDERARLDMEPDIPVLSISRVTYDAGDRPVEFVRSVYRGDQYQLHAILRTV